MGNSVSSNSGVKRILKWTMGVGLGLAILLPSFSSVDMAYQTSLWTYTNSRRIFSITRDPPSFWIQIPMAEPDFRSLVDWNRLQLGFPFKATTIDFQGGTPRLQARIELWFLGLNLAMILPISFVLFCLINTFRVINQKPRLDPKDDLG